MKLLNYLIIGLLISSSIQAQTPQVINYQGLARSIDGKPISNNVINVRIKIFSALNPQFSSFIEEHHVSTNQFGIFNLKIGLGNAVSGRMEQLDWGSAEHFISIELDADNSGHYVHIGTSQLLSVPYAFYAETAGKANDLSNPDQYRNLDLSGTSGQTIRHNGSDWTATSLLYNNGNNVGINTTSPSAKLDVNGTLNLTDSNEITVGGFRALTLDANKNLKLSHQAGNSVTTGTANNFVGWQAGKATTTGSTNIMIGYRTGTANTIGSSNSMIGNLAGYSNLNGNNNIFYGYRAGYSNVSGSNNFFSGTNAGHSNTTGADNIAIGTNSGFSNQTGSQNAFVGRYAGYNAVGDSNVFIGNAAGYNETGSNKLYISNSDTNEPLIYGEFDSGLLTVNGQLRVNDGNQADGYILTSDSSGNASWQVAASGDVLSDADGDTKIQVEESSDEDFIHFDLGGTEYFKMNKATLEINNSGKCVYVGNGAGASDPYSYEGVIDYENTGLGANALRDANGADHNVAVGTHALQALEGGAGNTAIGNSSLINNTSGSSNVAIGANAGRNNNGSGNVFIGQAAGFDESGSDKLYIDHTSTTSPLVWGDFSNNYLNVNGNLGINTTAPASQLHVYSASVNNTSVIAQSAASNAYIEVRTVDGSESAVSFQTGSSTRWILGKGNASESGSDGGSDFFINRYSDGGSFLSQPFRIKRNTGYVGINTSPNSQFEVNGASAFKISTQSGSTAVTLDNTATVWYFTGTASVTLPTASSCTNRIYTIVNRSGSIRTISNYTNLVGTTTANTIAANSSIEIISDGTNWLQIR